MKMLVMGTGGIGGYFGGRLAAAGNDVTFVARGEHLQAILRDGLQILSPNGNVTVKPAKAVSDPTQAEPPEIVIFATKLGDTERAAKSLKSVLREGAIIISLQNGVDGPDIIAAALPGAHVVPGLARISSHTGRPGAVKHKPRAGRIEFGQREGRASP